MINITPLELWGCQRILRESWRCCKFTSIDINVYAHVMLCYLAVTGFRVEAVGVRVHVVIW